MDLLKLVDGTGELLITKQCFAAQQMGMLRVAVLLQEADWRWFKNRATPPRATSKIKTIASCLPFI